ncbi:MAG: hypothetical protein HQL37_14670 [Alphaproteobacteria bacterium]|nr:hypothetical protein [Alphaproteobacteria bacterium]
MDEDQNSAPELIDAFKEGIPEYYSNKFALVTTEYDMRLTFGKAVRPGNTGLSAECTIYMSLFSARRLLEALGSQLQEIEQFMGRGEPPAAT